MGSPAKGDAAPQAEDQLTGKLPGPIVALLQFCDEAALHPGHTAHCTLQHCTLVTPALSSTATQITLCCISLGSHGCLDGSNDGEQNWQFMAAITATITATN